MRPYQPYANNYTPGNFPGYTPGWNPCLDAHYNPYAPYGQMSEGGGTVPTPAPSPMCQEGTMPYTVEEGDTLYNIARMYGTTVQQLLAANPGLNEMSMLYIGQMICVPIARPCDGQNYTVQVGDTIYSIARKFGVAPAELMAANPGLNGNNLMAGILICVPAPAMMPCPTGSMSYTVVGGDTLTSIAERFSVSVYSLTVANPGFSPENLTPGTRLCIAPFACLPACVESERYLIAEGEDLMKLAEKFQVSTDDLLRTNPFAPPCWFLPGNSICLPANAAPAPGKKKA